jgi:16S rRNA (guanine527-N7)-methyltransferase
MGGDGSAEVSAKLEVLAAAVETSPHNLISARAAGEIRSRHIPECVALAAMLPNRPTELLDVGSGGGFPGLVIAAVRRDLRITLLDSTRKKTDFLQETAQAMGVDVEVVNDRAERFAVHRPAHYGLVTARAVAPLQRLIGWTVPFLTADGLVYAIKGDRWEQELDEATGELRRHEAHVVATPSDIHGHDGRATAATPKVVIIGRAP